MRRQTTEPKILPLFCYLNATPTTTYIIFKRYPDVTRNQVRFLVLCSLIGGNTFKSAMFNPFAFGQNLAAYNLRTLTKVGYFVHATRKSWVITDKFTQFITDFTAEYNRRITNPFRWR